METRPLLKSQLELAREAYARNPTKENCERCERLFAQEQRERLGEIILTQEGYDLLKKGGQ